MEAGCDGGTREDSNKRSSWSVRDVQGSLNSHRFLFGDLCRLSLLPWALNAKFPSKVWGWRASPQLQCPIGPSPCTLLGQEVVSLALGPLLFPITLTALRAASASCYIVLLFSTPDSIRYLLSFSFLPLDFDTNLESAFFVKRMKGDISWGLDAAPHI